MIPDVSVLMAVYNGRKYLQAAVESILAQASCHFEFVIVDDGSSDGSAEWIEHLADERIRLIRTPHAGLVAALNHGLTQVRGRYVARMDSDDIARYDRLAVQSAYLDAHPETGVVCSNVRIIDSEGRVVGNQRDDWTSMGALRDGLLYQRKMKPIIHPSVMMRGDVFETLCGYRNYDAAEDRDFWLRALDYYRIDRLEQELLDYRIHPGGISREKGVRQAASSAMAAINWQVRERTGLDLFMDKPDAFALSAELVLKRLESEVMPAAFAFRKSRADIREGHFLKGMLGLVDVIAHHGRKGLPSGELRATCKIIEQEVQRIGAGSVEGVS